MQVAETTDHWNQASRQNYFHGKKKKHAMPVQERGTGYIEWFFENKALN